MKREERASGNQNRQALQRTKPAKSKPKQGKVGENPHNRLIELSTDILSITGSDGYVVDLNPASENIFGFTAKELKSKPALEFVHPDDRKRVLSAWQKVSLREESVNFESRGLCKDGSYKWISWTAHPSLDKKLIYSVGRDITEHRMTDQKISQHANQIKEINANVTDTARIKNEFMANVSHELRTPLTLLLVPLESSLDGEYGILNKSQEGALRTVHNHSLRLLQIVNGILDFSGYATGTKEVKREPIDIAAITLGMLGDFQPMIKLQGLEYTFVAVPPKAFAMMDRYIYERILFNLLSNAIKFTEKGGHVSVAIKLDKNRLQVSVADTGIGIEEADLKNLFQKFTQLESSSTRRFEGLGLGLALAKEFASLLDGTISIQSKRGKGSTFTLECSAPHSTESPTKFLSLKGTGGSAQKESSPQSKERSSPEYKSEEGLPKILVAEDNLELATYIRTILRGLYQIKLAPNGQEALEIAREWLPDLILSNIMMPKMDGLEFCVAVKSDAELATIPFVLLTALTHRDALLKGWEAGADEYLFKPFHSTELLTRIKSMILARQEHQMINQMKTDFVAFAAHQLKTPEAEIKAYVDNLLDGLAGHLTEEQKHYLVKIKEINTGNIRLIADLLSVSKIDREKNPCNITSTPLKKIIQRAAQDYLDLAKEKGLNFQVKDDDGRKIIVLADLQKAVEAVKNVIDNAIRFTDQGTIAIEIMNEDHVGVIKVKDTGTGIPEHILSKLFKKELVFDNPRPRGGSGLGLYIAKSFMKLQGGDLTVTSTVGEGSTFTFTFPRSNGQEVSEHSLTKQSAFTA